MNLIEMIETVDEANSNLSTARKNKKVLISNLKIKNEKLEVLTEARIIIQKAAEITQKSLESHISNLVSSALEAVFDDPYELKVEFISRRNTTECDLSFEKDGDSFDPLEGTGGGAVDIASFALRVSFHSLLDDARNTIILDEPMKFLSSDLQAKASDMIKTISDKLNIQIIMVSHSPQMIECADRVFEVTMKDKISTIKLIEEF